MYDAIRDALAILLGSNGEIAEGFCIIMHCAVCHFTTFGISGSTHRNLDSANFRKATMPKTLDIAGFSFHDFFTQYYCLNE